METIVVNYVAVLACGIISMILGSLWYGPLFGKPWMRMMGISKGEMTPAVKKAMMKSYTLMFIGSLVTAFVLSNTLSFLTFAFVAPTASGVVIGMLTAFWLWLGFIAPITMGNVIWEGKSWKLWLINNGYNLVFLMISGIILTLWR